MTDEALSGHFIWDTQDEKRKINNFQAPQFSVTNSKTATTAAQVSQANTK